MGKPSGFLDYQRLENTTIPPKQRITSFDEFHTFLDEEERRKQGARCMNCGVPFCQSAIKIKGMVTGCPLHNLIPEWNDEIYKGNYETAMDRLLKTNPFPEFTGRVCPALCEKACINGRDGNSVTVNNNELFIIETAYKNKWMKAKPPVYRSGKKIAVIGSGPSGLSCAYTLNKRGHSVTVYEREDKPGGLLMYGIPNMKLDKSAISRRVNILEEEGIEFKCNTNVGIDVSLKDLQAQYDAIVLCCGSKQGRTLRVENETAEGVYFAVDFLTKNTKHVLNEKEKFVNAKGKNVVIVGGGDTGNDCCGTVIRQGCKSVVQLEMMPQPPVDRLPSNPWPEWPKVLKTDYGQQEAIYKFGNDPRIYQTTIKKINTKGKKINSIETVQVQFKDGKLVNIENSEKVLDCDILLIAAGFTGIESYVKENLGLKTTPRNTVLTTDSSYKTENEKLFVCGDARRGQSLVVWAITEGRECAREVDEYLMGYSNIE